MTPEERREMFNKIMGKAKQTAADAQKAASDARKFAKETKRQIDEATGEAKKFAKKKKQQFDDVVDYVAKGVEKVNETMDKTFGVPPAKDKAVKPTTPQKPKQKKGHWKI